MPASESENGDENAAIIIPINQAFSDGDPSTWPKTGKSIRADDAPCRKEIARMWMRWTGKYEKGMILKFEAI